jgi:hypothetical protein
MIDKSCKGFLFIKKEQMHLKMPYTILLGYSLHTISGLFPSYALPSLLLFESGLGIGNIFRAFSRYFKAK